MLTTALILAIITAVVAIALGAAYQFGLLDNAIETVGMYLFKAKAKAEKKKLQAEGMKEGQDFFEGWFQLLIPLSLLFQFQIRNTIVFLDQEKFLANMTVCLF